MIGAGLLGATTGPRPWVWLAALGLLVSAVLVYRAGSAIFRALPADVQADAGTLLKRHARLAAAGGVILLWTLVYALYSLGLPTVVTDTARQTGASARARSGGTGTTTPLVALPPLTSGGDFGSGDVTDDSGTSPTTPAPSTGAGPTVPAPPKPEPPSCDAAALGDATRQAQMLAEMLTGRPVGADFALLVEAAAGCGDLENATLSLLSPVDDLLDQLGVPDAIDLPGLPELPVTPLPDAVSEPFRPYVFQICAQVQAELVTVAAVAPAIHLNYSDLSAAFKQVDTVCKAFAKP